MEAISDGRYDQVGTFNGNPLTMAAARTVLADVLTPEAYRTAEALGREMFDAASAALAAHGQPCYGVVHGFKGSVVFHDRPATNYLASFDSPSPGRSGATTRLVDAKSRITRSSGTRLRRGREGRRVAGRRRPPSSSAVDTPVRSSRRSAAGMSVSVCMPPT